MSDSKLSLRGVLTPIPTPFDGEGSVAYWALADNLTRWNDFDLTGYIVLGSNGEAVYLDDEEKERVWETARRAIPSGKLMIAGTGAESTRKTIALSRRAAQAGADAVLVVTPNYYAGLMTSDALVAHYVAVAEATPVPVLIYNVPKFTGVDMAPTAIAKAAQHPNIVGIKETGGNVAKIGDTIRLAGPDFQLLAGSAGFFLASLAVGAAGGILALAIIAPQEALEIYRLFHAGQLQEAAELQRLMIPVNAAITARYGIAGAKAALDILGYYGGPVRSPLQDLGPVERQDLKDALLAGGVL